MEFLSRSDSPLTDAQGLCDNVRCGQAVPGSCSQEHLRFALSPSCFISINQRLDAFAPQRAREAIPLYARVLSVRLTRTFGRIRRSPQEVQYIGLHVSLLRHFAGEPL